MSRKRPVALALVLAVILGGFALTRVFATFSGAANGRIAAAIRAPDDSANIFTQTPDGKGVLQLTSGPGLHLCPSYSRDGRDLVYCADVTGAFEIWTMKQNGTKQAQLTHFGARAVFPHLSPGGAKVVFTGFVGAPKNDQIYVTDAATGTTAVELTSCAADHPDCFNQFANWSPDGTRIAFVHGDGVDANGNNINEQVWVMNADGSNARQLTTGSDPKDSVPDWSPDGTKIAYHSGQDGSGGIWVMDADGSNQRQLTGCAPGAPSPCATGDDFAPAWSPDGEQIAFLRDLRPIGTNDRPIYVINADGTGVHRVTLRPGLNAIPSWQVRGAGSDQ